MKITVFILSMILCSSQSFATNYRSYCKKYHRDTNIQTCINQQKGAHKSIESGRYATVAIGRCQSQFVIRDRVSNYTNWVGYEKCVREEQRYIDESESQHANTRALDRNTNAIILNSRFASRVVRSVYVRRKHAGTGTNRTCSKNGYNGRRGNGSSTLTSSEIRYLRERGK